MALALLVVGGCASSTGTSLPVSSEPPGTETPNNFASPTDLFHRYPTMRRQDL